MCDELTKKRKRSFSEAWLTDERYKFWIREVSSDSNMYYCNVCNKNYSCDSIHVSRHANSACHKNNLEKNTLSINDDTSIHSSINDTSIKKCNNTLTFKKKWLYFEQFKCWLREAPHDENLFYCLICDKYLTAHLSHIYRHAESEAHVNKCKSSFNETSESNENLNVQNNESLLLFEERIKEAEIRFATLITEKNIAHTTANEILSLFQYIGKDPNVLQSMKMSRKKCTNIITNVLSPVETERVVNNIQNTKFTIFIDETSDICNDKWMTFLVRYIEPKTLDNRTQLVKLIDIDARDCSAEKLYEAFRNEMWTLQIPFTNIVALSCDNASVMTGKHLSFKKKLEQVCPRLLTFSCPCHSSALIANAACNKIPDFCEEFIKKIARYINSSPKRSAVFTEFCECFQEKSLKILKLCDTRWLSRYFCVERLLEYWDTIRYFLYEIVVSEKAGPAKDLLSIMDNVETKAYFLFLQYILDLFNKFNAHFQSLETRIHELQPKSLTLLYKICQNFLKNEHIQCFSVHILFSLKENQRNLDEINLGSECQEYLNELMMQGHENVVTIVRSNCLMFYVTAAEEIRKRLPVNDIFLSKLNVFGSSVCLQDTDRETSFSNVLFVAQTIGGFDEDALKKEWFALPLDFALQKKISLAKLRFDDMWKQILQSQYPKNIDKYPNLTKLLNAVRSLPNSNADAERMFSFLTDLKTKKRNKLSSVSVNAACIVKSALKARGETSLSMTIEEKHLSRMSTNILYSSVAKKKRSTLGLRAADTNDIAGPSRMD